MKTAILFFAVMAFGLNLASAQTTGPVMTFNMTTIDYGFLEKGADSIRKFKFTNTGNEPLIVKSGKPSCQCVQVTYPQEPIMPGESASIEVKYDTQRIGNFNKQVTVTTNETPDTHTLTLKGEVKPPPTQEQVPAGNGGLKQ